MTMDLIRGVRFAIVTMLLFGGAYPFAVWGLAQTAFRHQAQGSLITRADGSIVGSTLIAQPFEGDAYVHPRPSGVDYNAASTGGTNFGPTNPDHLKAVGERVAAVRQREALPSGAIPADLVTASGAGLDPHLSPAAVDVQVARVARVRGASVDAVRTDRRRAHRVSHAWRPRAPPRERTAAEPGAGRASSRVARSDARSDRTRPMTDRARQVSMWEGAIVRQATVDAFTKLDPRVQVRNPVMCLVTVGSLLTTVVFVQDVATGTGNALFTGQVALWLWFTVLFANFAEAMAEGRGKAQANTLRKTRTETVAHRLDASGRIEDVAAASLRKGDRVRVSAGEFIPADGEIVEGVASVDESAITGESAPVIRESGGDRSAVTGGTRVLSDVIVVQVTADPGHTFLDRMIALVEGAQRQKTPNELALGILLAVLSLVFLLVVVTLEPFARYAGTSIPIPVLVALLVCLIPTTIGALISAIGIAGMDRLVQHNVLAMSGRAVEAAGDVDTLLLDKTGTITLGNRQAAEFLPVAGDRGARPRRGGAARVAGGRDARGALDRRARQGALRPARAHARAARGHVRALHGADTHVWRGPARPTPAQGCSRGDRHVRARTRRQRAGGAGGLVDRVSRSGGTPLVVADDGRALGVVHLKDIVKGGMRQRFDALRAMGIRTVMITGDNPVTAAAIAKEAGVDDFLAEAKPEDKMALIKREQAAGKLVAMTGDGTNDAPALAQADVGVAMNSGTTAAKEAGNMVDLDSNPTKLIEIVEIGKQLLMTRGALTTFSIANDVAKYFAIIPAMFLLAFPQLQALNVMRLATPESAILSAVIFNALIIIALIPLALRGVSYTPLGAAGRAAAEPAPLRPRRRDRAVRRHQGHRPGARRPGPRVRGRRQ